MKKRNLLTLLSVILALSLAIGFSTMYVSAEGETTVDYALDGAKWQRSTNAAFDADGMRATAASYAWVTNEVGGNSTVKVTSVANIADSTWGYSWVMVKSDGTQTAWDPGQATSTGNFIAVGIGRSAGAVYVYECADGEVTVDKAWRDFNNAFVWYEDRGTTVYEITSTDTDTGVKLDITITGKENAQAGGSAVCSWTYNSANKQLWGNQNIIIGHTGSGTFDGTQYYKYNVEVTDRASAYVYDPYTRYDNDAEKWGTLSNVTVTDSGMYQTANSSSAITTPFGGNATIKLDVDFVEAAGGWGGLMVMVKGSAEDYAATAWGWGSPDRPVVNSAQGSWIAVFIGNGKCGVITCDNGTVTEKTDAEAFTGINGNSFWYVHKQKNSFVITTEDYADGAKINIAFTPSGYAANTGDTYFYTANIENKALWGEQSLAVLTTTGGGTYNAETNAYGVKIAAEDSGYEYVVDDGSVRYDNDAEKWETLSNVTVTEDGMYQTNAVNGNSSAVSVAFGANATVKLTVDYVNANGGYGGLIVMVKGTAADYAGTVWKWDSATASATSAQGSWVAVYIYNGAAGVYICKNGVVTDISNAFAGINGYSFWYVHKQTNTFVITTEDTATGANVTISFTPSGHESNTGATFSYTASVEDKMIWGEQNLSVVSLFGGGTYGADTNAYSVKVKAEASEYNKDMAKAYEVSALISAISYEEITAANYTAVRNATVAARTAYDALTQAQKNLINEAEYAVLTKAESDLENVDALVLAQYAISILPEGAFTVENYEENKELVLDAYEKYSALTDEQKAEISDDDTQKLLSLKAALDEFTVNYEKAAEVDGMIATLPETITVYGENMRAITAAKAAYDALTDYQKTLVASSAKLTAALKALSAYEYALYGNDYNFTASEENFAHVGTEGRMEYSENGVTVNIGDNGQSFVLGRKLGNGETVQFVIDSRLTNSGWGNFYFVFKHDEPVTCHSKGAWAQSGNYAVFLIGTDGFKVVECVNGVLPMGEDPNGNPIAQWSTILDDPSTLEGANNYDVWYVWKQVTVVTITTVDKIDEEDGFIGWEATITLTGGNSGATITRKYSSTNTAVQGAGYVGVEFFTGAKINEGSGGFNLRSVTVKGVETYDAKAEKAKAVSEKIASLPEDITAENVESVKAIIAEIKESYAALDDEYKQTVENYGKVAETEAAVAVYESGVKVAAVTAEIAGLGEAGNTRASYSEARASYLSVNAAYEALTDAEKAAVTNADKLAAFRAALEALKADIDAADGTDALITALITDVTAENINDAKAAYEAAYNAYAALTDAQKALLTEDAAVIETVKAAIDAIETPEKKGCFGGIDAGYGIISAFAALALAAVAKRRFAR
ncbi:MAG: hypothetical protein IJU84_09385 [Clostridia bacterium]|nr:hypothetical protein [Clostridia bacterium]